jgi:hypothetical protein
MNTKRLPWLLAFTASIAAAWPLSGQQSVSISGRVEDASTREPLAGVRIFAADSSSAVLTDSLGVFLIELGSEGPLAVQAERLGYLTDRFELDSTPAAISVILLQPAPIQLEGITVADEDAVTRLVMNLSARRNSYSGAMQAFDRVRLERELGSVLDFVQTRKSLVRTCANDFLKMCVRGRGATIANPNPQSRVLVCVDEVESLSPFVDLEALPIQAVAIVELYDRQIRIYTPEWLLWSARNGRTSLMPINLPALRQVC